MRAPGRSDTRRSSARSMKRPDMGTLSERSGPAKPSQTLTQSDNQTPGHSTLLIAARHPDDRPPANDAMEELNLWLGVGPQALASPPWSGLVYRPGRIIAFPDTTDALRYIGLENGGSDYVLNEGVWLGSFNKAEGMRLLTAALAGSFDTILFYRHLDASQTRCAEGAQVLGRCCPSPNRSTFARVMVGLHGWNRSRCPGHENLTYHSRECPCSAPPRSKGVDIWTC